MTLEAVNVQVVAFYVQHIAVKIASCGRLSYMLCIKFILLKRLDLFVAV